MNMKEASFSPISSVSICFYGAGSMAEAIFRGLIEAGLSKADRITVLNRRNADRLKELHQRYGVVPAMEEQAKQDALRTSDIIVLGMKPKDSAAALRSLAPLLRPEQLIISAIAGLSIDTIVTLLGGNRAIVRTMPNTSSTIRLGATGISFSASVSPMQQELALAMFGAVGSTTVVEEPLIEAVNGVSGTGPAYVYYLMEAMITAGVDLGLTREAARELTVQTVRGAAEMVSRTGEDPSDLRRKVTSPGGTTQAAVDTLERYRFQEGMIAAILRCAERAREMGEAIRSEATNP
jgi:pyrroline-5-carboxylate reductase